MINWIRSNGFLLGLFAILVLAWMIPDLGARGGMLKTELLCQVAVFVIFFIQGLGLPTRELQRGFTDWHPHAFVLGWNYLGFPIIACLGLAMFDKVLPSEIAFGLTYLALLPSTIASAVFFTYASGGEVSVAVFSAAISNLLSVFLVPLGVAFLLLNEGRSDLWLGSMVLKLCGQIALPMAVGQGLRPFVKSISALNAWFRRITTACLFLIMFCAFCDGVKNAAWNDLGWGAMCAAFAGALCLLGLGSSLVWWSSNVWKKDRPVRIATFLCASQKSMATGLPMATSLFSGSEEMVPDLSVIVIPLMIYHLMQLAFASRLTNKFTRSKTTNLTE